jgi:(1->4)-alpha-D-glucan 1-alpha-D-glucosylmutase
MLAHALEDLGARDPQLADLRENWPDGRIKLHVTATALAVRSARHDVFARGEYVPLHASGWARRHIVAFARRRGSQWAITVAPRFPAALASENVWPLGEWVWKSSVLRLPDRAPRRWRNALTGEQVDITRGGKKVLLLSDVLSDLPVALLMT